MHFNPSAVVPTLLRTLFGTSSSAWIVITAFFIAGEWGLLKKSGLKGWWALIPFVREFKLGQCAGREPEGRRAALAAGGAAITNVFLSLFTYNASGISIILMAIEMSLQIVLLIQHIFIFLGLIELYNAKKRWLLLWFFDFTRIIPALLWGWSEKWKPSWQVEEMRQEMTLFAEGKNIAVMNDGLTVNLKERHTREFFRKIPLLRDIHLYIPQGHMVLLLGGSGAGKTTLVNAINGYEKADAEITLNGRNMYKQYKNMKYETAFVPQQDLMRSKDTVSATLSDASKMRLPIDITSDLRKKRVNDVMEMFSLTSLKESLVQKLSGGQRKRLSIALEYISNPSLFILDEPDSGLDGVMARELMAKLRNIADSGKIVIVITHTPDRVIEYFDDVIVLAKDSARTGRLAFYGSIEDARSFFGCEMMEKIVKAINKKDEGGDGRADEYIAKYAEVQHA